MPGTMCFEGLVASRTLRLAQAMLAAARAGDDPVECDPIAVIPNDLLAAKFTRPHMAMVVAMVRLETPGRTLARGTSARTVTVPGAVPV
jgi:hypothetical protein